MYAAYKWLFFALVATWSHFALAKYMGGSANLSGNCDSQNECVVNLGAPWSRWRGLCNSSDFSALWSKGGERYLIQCRSGDTSEDSVVWVIDAKTGFFGKLYFGRFFKKGALAVGPNIEIKDKFQLRTLCESVEIKRMKESDFVLLDKRPMDEGAYCYAPVYLTLRFDKLIVETNDGPFKNDDVDHAVHEVSIQEKRRLKYLLDAIRNWHSEP
ncbi:hypothetical protein [Burkholderia stagnalis]|uniref:Uncharacterized protein n=1 Tax=Burkholderia stagnalis TaxID=1503054 RepID=A0A6L3N4V5_9BURK|nr:hypothetical protein [Burkholderia stagnalis]KAB0640113.1 hypothetical protein F7R25_05460 [Burkholderia stagnalis]VWB18556.1 hypothetical protein BST28156_00731 [Burkholderia stagnalis]